MNTLFATLLANESKTDQSRLGLGKSGVNHLKLTDAPPSDETSVIAQSQRESGSVE